MFLICLLLSISACLFFLCARASLLSICPPFLFLLLERLSLFIDRFQRSCFLFILSTDRIMKQFSSVFPSPNFMLSHCPLFSFSGLLSPNRVPYFPVVPLSCSLSSLFFFRNDMSTTFLQHFYNKS